MGEIACNNENFEFSETEQKDLFGEPVIQKNLKQLPHKYSNVRRERFVREYVICGNATEAAMRAGYGEKTPQSERYERCKHYGSWLKRQPDVIECLSHYTGELKAKELIRLEDIVGAVWETYNDPRLAPSRREPLLSLLGRLGGHFNDKLQVDGDLLALRHLIEKDAANNPQGESSHISTPVAAPANGGSLEPSEGRG